MPKDNPIASYVEKYILNPGARIRPTLDDINEETVAVVSKRVEGEESAKAAHTSISKLRLQNTEILGDRDPRYRGKTVSRKDIEGSSSSLYEPEVAKLFNKQEWEHKKVDYTDDLNDNYLKKLSPSLTKEKKVNKSKPNKDKQSKEITEEFDDDYMKLGEEFDEEESDSEEEEDDNSIDEDENDVEEGEDDDDESTEDFSDVEQQQQQSSVAIKTFSTESTDHIAKGLAVKNQCSIFDGLFEARIGLQKVSSVANQLPQHDVYEQFLKNKNYPQYKVNLIAARKAVKRLIAEIMDLQETLLLNNSEVKNILTSERLSTEPNNSEVASSDEESSQNEEKKGTKRKIEEFEEVLSKRHKAIIPFRDETLNKWYEKAKLLVNQTRGNFSNFEISPVQQVKNILANKDQLLMRTQLLGVSRGNVYKILGKAEKEQDSLAAEEYDPEIFDDSDFYTRMLEDVLKSKMSVSDDMTEVSRKWIDIQKLRKKAKKKVEMRASKGRKIRFEVMSKLQQFIAPCKPSQMDDDATNKLFSSLFGQSTKNYSETIK